MNFGAAVDLLANSDWHGKIEMPLSLKAGQLLAHLAGGNKLTAEVLSFQHAAVTELVKKGIIQLNIGKRDKKTGVTPGKIMRLRVVAMADEVIAAIDERRHAQ